ICATCERSASSNVVISVARLLRTGSPNWRTKLRACARRAATSGSRRCSTSSSTSSTSKFSCSGSCSATQSKSSGLLRVYVHGNRDLLELLVGCGGLDRAADGAHGVGAPAHRGLDQQLRPLAPLAAEQR